MFAEKCLLCLDSVGDSTGQIAIDSAEGQALNLQQLLEKYFEHELNGVLSCTTARILCCECWKSISAFREFCLRVQRAHTAAANTLQSCKELITVEDLGEVVNHCRADSPPKRRRGRPRKAATKLNVRLPETLAADIQLKECKIEIEKLNLPFNKCNAQLEEPQLSDVKQEALREELIDADCPADGCQVQQTDELMPSQDHTQTSDSDTELNKRKEKTRISRKKERPCKKSDEYISKHTKLSCCLCRCPLKNFSDLKLHFQKEHQTIGYVLCCGKKLLNRGVLVDHLHVHEDPEYFKCSHCGKVMADRRCLEVHLKIHEGEAGRTFRCKICSKAFSRRSSLRLHTSIHIPTDQRKFTCPQCDKVFSDKVTLTQHINLVHLKMFLKICDICGKALRGRELLQRHMDEHAGVERTLIQCELCGSALVDKYALARHMKTMHTEEYRTPQTCSICSKVSPSLRAHKYHIRFMHDMKRKHSCPMCEKAFKRPMDLKEHMATHTGEVLYTCTFCPKTFNSNANMYAHRKKLHPKEWAESRLQRCNAVRKAKESEIRNDFRKKIIKS